MTTTYLIHAWCMRPFIAYLDPVEAATPEEAIAIARGHPKRLIDTAEECNGQYPWDEFAAYGENGNELLHVLDDAARLRDAAPRMWETLLYVAQMLADFKPVANMGTSSFVLLTVGCSLLLLSVFYLVIDVWKIRGWAFFFAVIGANAITIYVGQKVIDFDGLAKLVFSRHMHELLLESSGFALKWIFLFFLYKQRIFLRV